MSFGIFEGRGGEEVGLFVFFPPPLKHLQESEGFPVGKNWTERSNH